MEKPLVSIALFAYNAKNYVEEAIRSILDQTYRHFELIIIEDKSTDGTAELIKKFDDPRIRFIWNERNSGIRHNRQLALRQAKGKYLFWMDNDDISTPNRIEKQVSVFEKDPGIVLCGTTSVVIDQSGNEIGIKKLPSSDATIKATAFFGFPWESATVGIRTNIINQDLIGLLSKVEQADDYTLYSAMIPMGRFHNIPEPLYKYREHRGEHRITTNPIKAADIVAGRKVAWGIQLASMGLQATDEVLILHDKITYYRQFLTKQDLMSGQAYLKLLLQMFKKSADYSSEYKNELKANIKHKAMWLLINPQVSLTTAFKWQWYFGEIIPSLTQVKTIVKKLAMSFGKTISAF